jgi:hypothetical protein
MLIEDICSKRTHTVRRIQELPLFGGCASGTGAANRVIPS